MCLTETFIKTLNIPIFMKDKKYSIIILVAALVIGLVFGYFLASAQAQFQIKQAHLTFNDKADIYDAKFHDLMQEHTFILINTARRSLDSADSFNGSMVALQRNVNDLSDQIATVYPTDSNDVAQFKSLWTTEINMFIKYTNSVKSGDPTASTTFASDAAAYEEASASFWSNPATPLANLDKATVKQLITSNVNNMKAAVDYWGARDYTNYFLKTHDAYTQVGAVADIFVTAIVTQHPEAFS